MVANIVDLNSGDFLPANEVAKLAGVTAANPTLQPNKWKRDQDIFAIRHGREGISAICLRGRWSSGFSAYSGK
jgi:hypothetical protein